MGKRMLAALWLAAFISACSGVRPRAVKDSVSFQGPFKQLVEDFLKSKTELAGKKLVVYEFPDVSGRVEPEGRLAAEILTTRLVQTGQFDVVERGRLEAVLKELRLSSSGAIDEQSAMHAGRILGAGAAITGTLARVNGKFEINARAIDVGTGEILAGAMVEVDESALSVKENSGRTDGMGPVFLLTSRGAAPASATHLPYADQAPKGWEMWPGWNNSYGRFATEGNSLTYYLFPGQHDHTITADRFSGYHPGLLLARPVTGRNWTIDMKVRYRIAEPAGKWLSACLWLGPGGIRPSLLQKGEDGAFCIFRQVDSGSGTDDIAMQYMQDDKWRIIKEIPKDTEFFRFRRDGNRFGVDYSADGASYSNGLKADVSELRGDATVKLVLGGQEFVGGGEGSYAEYDYINVNDRPDVF